MAAVMRTAAATRDATDLSYNQNEGMNDHVEAEPHRHKLKIGSIIFDDMDQIDFTGPLRGACVSEQRHIHHIWPVVATRP